MKNEDERPNGASELRRRAEVIANEKGLASSKDLAALVPADILRMLHELQVHQVELEMQNSELLRAQEELEAVRARYFDLYNLAPVGYFILSLEGLILEVNLTAAEMLGLPRAALIKKPIPKFIFRDDQDIYYLHRRELLVSGKPGSCELRMLKGDGTVFWGLLTTSSVPDPASEVGGNGHGAGPNRIVLSDISERKRVEAEKAELEMRLRQAQRPEGGDRP